MTHTGWILTALLLVVIIVLVTQFGRLARYFVESHREERAVVREGYASVVQSLEETIRQASGTGSSDGKVTNIFAAPATQHAVTNQGAVGQQNVAEQVDQSRDQTNIPPGATPGTA